MARRRRDSLFPKKGALSPGSKARRFLTRLLCLLSAIFLLLLLGGYQLFHWLQGDSFRQKMELSLCDKAQAGHVRIPENLQIDGNLLTLPAISLSRSDLLERGSAKRISMTIDRKKLLDRIFHISKLNIEEASISLNADHAGNPLPPRKKAEKSFWDRFTPKTVALLSVECSDTDISLSKGKQSYSLSGCKINAAPLSGKDSSSWSATIENGRLHTPFTWLQETSIRNANITYQPGRIRVPECLIMLNPGEMKLSGSYHPQGKQWNAELRTNKANVARLLNADWKKRLTGELYGQARFSGTGGRIEKASGTILLKKAVLEGLPILSELDLGDSRPYRSLQLEKAECRLSYPYTEPYHHLTGAWLFDRIDIRSQGETLLIRGHVIIGSDGSLGGTLNIGLPEAIVSALPLPEPAINSIFNGKGAAGYRWININLSGTVSSPQEDLSVRLATVLRNALPQAAGKAAGLFSRLILRQGQTEENAQEQPILPPSSPDEETPYPRPGIEEAPEAIEEATDVLNGVMGAGLRSLF